MTLNNESHLQNIKFIFMYLLLTFLPYQLKSVAEHAGKVWYDVTVCSHGIDDEYWGLIDDKNKLHADLQDELHARVIEWMGVYLMYLHTATLKCINNHIGMQQKQVLALCIYSRLLHLLHQPFLQVWWCRGRFVDHTKECEAKAVSSLYSRPHRITWLLTKEHLNQWRKKFS